MGNNRLLQIIPTIGAELVGFGDFAFALRAGRMQVALAIGAEVEAGAYGVSALWTRIGQRLAHQEVNDKTDEPPRRQGNNDQNVPPSHAHSAARGPAGAVVHQAT